MKNQRAFTSSVTKNSQKESKCIIWFGWKEAIPWRSFSQSTTSSLPQNENRTSDDFRSSSTLAGELLISWVAWCFLKKCQNPMFLPRLLIFPSQIPRFPHISRSSRHSYGNFWSPAPLWLKTLNFWRKNVGKPNCFGSNLPDLEIEICRVEDSMVKFAWSYYFWTRQGGKVTGSHWDTMGYVLNKRLHLAKMIVFRMVVSDRYHVKMSDVLNSTPQVQNRHSHLHPAAGSPQRTWSLSPLAEAALVYLHPLIKRSLHRSVFFVRGHH